MNLKRNNCSQLEHCCCYCKCPGSPTIVSFFTGLQWTVGRGCTIPSHYIEVRHDTYEAYCIALSRCTHYSKLFNMSNLRLINAHSKQSNVPTTVGSRSTNTALGTCLPAPVSLKNVLNESSPPPIVLSLGICPSGWMPCSRQYNSQHALPICTPAWPTWILIHSR